MVIVEHMVTSFVIETNKAYKDIAFDQMEDYGTTEKQHS
jgi:hypothetical protein